MVFIIDATIDGDQHILAKIFMQDYTHYTLAYYALNDTFYNVKDYEYVVNTEQPTV